MYTPVMINKLGVERWFVFSKKLNREIILYGKLEYDHWVLVEIDPSVINYCERPLEIEHSYFGKPDKVLIDMWIQKATGDEFINVTYANKIDPNDNEINTRILEKVSSVKLWAQQHNHKFSVRTEKDIYANSILLDNLKSLLPYNHDLNTINNALKDKIIDQIRKGKTNVSELSSHFANIMNIYEFQKTLYILILRGLVSSDIDHKPLGLDTEVYLQ